MAATVKKKEQAVADGKGGNMSLGGHLSELKNRIDKQIVVTKEKSGGSKAEILC